MKHKAYKGAWVAALLLAVSMSGCGKDAAEERTQTVQESTEADLAENGEGKEEGTAGQPALETAEAPEKSPEERAASFTAEKAQTVQKDGDNLYFIYQDLEGKYKIGRQPAAGGTRTDMIEGRYIRQFTVDHGNLYVECEEALWFVDGESLEKEKLFDVDRELQNLCVKDGLLYCEMKTRDDTSYEDIFYALDENGRIEKKLEIEDSVTARIPVTEEEAWWLETKDFALSIRDEEIFYVRRGADGQPEEERTLVCRAYPTVLYYDRDSIYLSLNKEPAQDRFFASKEILRFDRETMATETIAEFPCVAGLNDIYLNGPVSMGFLDGRIYYVYPDQAEGKDYLMSCEPGKPDSAVKVGEAISQDPLNVLGTVSVEGENIFCPQCNARDWYWQRKLFLEEKYPGDAAINTYLEQFYQEKAAYAKEFIEQSSLQEGGCIHEYISGAISSEQKMQVMYDGGRYLNLLNNTYEYGGGAHGMPSWEPLLFDRETGKKLELADVIGNTEEELKTMVADAFCNPPYYEGLEDWAGRRDAVYQAAGMEMLFHLSDDGITFFFTPYEVASYAEGFPAMTIPYDQLKMKISL